MNFHSLLTPTIQASFKQATLQGQPEDRSLFYPNQLASLDADFINKIKEKSKLELALRVMQPFVGDDIPENELLRILDETLCFDIPMKKLSESVSILELFHGPTLAFKDVGARFMSRCIRYFTREENKKVTILVATSGDTGGAVADGFYDVEGVEVIILYPHGKVSPVQEKQLTALGKNIYALEIDGDFDDCQRMVKTAFADTDIQSKKNLCSANSINVARWLPQQLYYFLAYSQWQSETKPVVSVPSGNFGNLCAGMLAAQRGLPTQHFIAACNSNDTIPRYIESQIFSPRPTIATMSNAMDVSLPSNFIRIEAMYDKDLTRLQKDLSACTVSEDDTLAAIIQLYHQNQYIADPHGAVAFHALQSYLQQHPEQSGYFVETAHPVKFPDAISKALSLQIPIPASLEDLMKKEKQSTRMAANDNAFKDYLMSHHT